jgi:hypothetical protein
MELSGFIVPLTIAWLVTVTTPSPLDIDEIEIFKLGYIIIMCCTMISFTNFAITLVRLAVVVINLLIPMFQLIYMLPRGLWASIGLLWVSCLEVIDEIIFWMEYCLKEIFLQWKRWIKKK